MPCFERGSAVALSVVAHGAIAVVMLGGVGLIENRRAAAGEGRLAITWVALPEISSPQSDASDTLATTPVPTVTIPTVAPPRVEPPKLDEPPVIAATVLFVSTQVLSPAPSFDPVPSSWPGQDGPVGSAEEVSGDPATRPSCGGVAEVHASPAADRELESEGGVRDVIGPMPLPGSTTTAGAPPEDNREHDVQFWIRADGRVTKIAVTPPIRDSRYRRRFREAVSSFVFGPVRTADGRPIAYVYRCVVYP